MMEEHQVGDDINWKEFTERLYYVMIRMTSALYAKDILRRSHSDDGKKDKQLWELVTDDAVVPA